MTIHDFTHDELALKLGLKVRVATPEDIQKLEWNGQYTHFRNLFRRAYVEQKRKNRLLLIMDFNNYPIARLFIQFIGQNETIDDDNQRGYIYSFNVMEPFRNLGIGTRMLNTAESILRNRGYQLVTISVAKDNSGALKLYRRAGYQIYGEDDGQWQFRDHMDNLHQMNEPSWLMKKALS